ncbi:MAG: 2-oxoacid:ferredoxin oxidoreductase subunit beta [Anaerolineae bacterium]|nr:2-oxoacid:ferredoxin oxidoreductase subunit beta [Anaerolineae bacterium]MBL6965487.1 2-oxoacid:ferredoxin oxidoreductase subunit beta [Anaerolineales bacterium]
MATKSPNVNLVNLSKADYRGAPTTLCQGCGHNSITSQLITACYELSLTPEDIVKFSGIGCSSKAPTYFLDRAFGFNGLHGRMPSLATGTMFADTTLTGIGMSGDGDSASIGMGQFKHVMRRNLPLVYIIANNGVYGLTKGQFSATAEEGLALKGQGQNQYMPIDIVWEAVISNATFVARSFAGDPKQVRELLKAALNHRGIAVLDIISPCVTFNNQDDSHHSYAWGREHEVALHDLSYVPVAEEIMVDYEDGEAKEVTMHDGSRIMLRKVDNDYDPTDRSSILCMLEDANRRQELLTGLIYIDTNQESLFDLYNLPDEPLNRLTPDRIRPSRESLDEINALMF